MDKNDYVKKMLLFVLIVVVIFIVFYGITVLVTSNNNETAEGDIKTDTNIDYDQILIGSMYNLNDDSYYVLVEMQGDNNVNKYESSRTEYISKDGSLKVYVADLSSAFNKKYISGNSEFNIGTSNYPQFSKTTLVKIDDNKLSEVYEGDEQITEQFNKMNEA